MKQKLIFSLFILLIPIIGFSQGREITGTVTDVATGEPLIGANVVIQGTTQGTVTDADGNYSITAESDDVDRKSTRLNSSHYS